MKNRPLEGELVVSRRFDAPRELVWKAFTEVEHLAHWWGGEGRTEVVEFDLRPGGVFRCRIGERWGAYMYREVAAPKRLAFVASFTDAAGGLLEIESTVTLSEKGGRTLVTSRSVPVRCRVSERTAA